MVKGGHCIDITYYHPTDNISTFYEEDQSYCHKRSCAKKTFRKGFECRDLSHIIWVIYDMTHIWYNDYIIIHISMKGCVASDDFILEVWKRKFESKNPNITITEGMLSIVVALKSLPQNWNSDTKHLPRNLSACHEIYGSPPEYMGTYYMYEDYNIWGISHVPVSGGVSLNITFTLEIISIRPKLCSVWTYVRTT